MQFGNSRTRWGAVTIVLHWSIAALILTAMATGVLNNQLQGEDPAQRALASWLVDLHRSCGVTALALGLVRLVWSAAQPRPDLPPAMNRFDRRASLISHKAIYALAILVPLTGALTTTAFGRRIDWFGLVTLPAPFQRTQALVAPFYHAHWLLYHLLLVTVVLHAGAALWHHFSQRDPVLRRMLPLIPPPSDRER